MARVVYAVPQGVAAPMVRAFRGLKMTWTGWDGSVWDLTNPAGGAFLTDGGLVGLEVPPGFRFVTTSPAVAGSRHRGTRVDERPVVWPMHVWTDQSSEAWQRLSRQLWNTFRRDRTGTWAVTELATNTTRTLEVRFVRLGDGPSLDPYATGYADYKIELVAEDPYWRGEPIEREFEASTPTPFLPGPPFPIGDGASLSSARIPNPGDVDAWPVWEIHGPCTEVTVGVNGHTIGLYGDLDADDVLVIDTDPSRQSATLNGVRVRGVLAPREFAPIPAGGVAPLTVTMVGTGLVKVRIVPLFERAA